MALSGLDVSEAREDTPPHFDNPESSVDVKHEV
jgi:hypothetical protein